MPGHECTRLRREEDGGLSGNGELELGSANHLLSLLAPGAGVPLTGAVLHGPEGTPDTMST